MAMRSGILPLSSMEDVVGSLVVMDNEQFATLHQYIARESFSLSKASIGVLASGLLLSEEDTASLVATLKYLYDHLDSMKLKDEERRGEISNFLEGVLDDDDDANAMETAHKRLSEVLEQSPAHAAREKVRRLEAGFLPSLMSFSSLVDLRPDFDDDIDGIRGFVPVITISLRTDSRSPDLQRVVVNVPIAKLEELSTAVDRIKKKYEKMKSEFKL